MDQETIAIIRRAQKGDAAAFHKLVAIYDGRVMALAYRLLENERDAEDLYQDVFLKVFKKLKTFRFESDFFTWLYRITANTAFNFKRKAGRFRSVEPDAESGEGYLHWLPDPEATGALESVELQDAISQAVNRLPQRQRTVFVLKHLEKRKISEIAGLLGCGEGTVKRYLFRAMEKLRSELKGYRYA
ncbi:MAG: RNA polymerase sigma factor [Fidelibacterota bacterium]